MDFSDPFRTLTPTLDGPVLRALARTTAPMSRSQLVANVGSASEAGVRKVLHRLAGEGLVIEQRIGNQFSYRANREHLVWAAVEVVVRAVDALVERMHDQVSGWSTPPLSVELFGSVSTGRATATSDVDVMVFRPWLGVDAQSDWDGQVAALRHRVRLWTGNECEILELDAPRLSNLVADDGRVLNDPRITVYGDDLVRSIPSRPVAEILRSHLADDRPGFVDRVRDAVEMVLRRPAGPELIRTIEQLERYARAVEPV